MFDVIGDISWLAVVLAAVAYYVLGALWFTPLFGKHYDEATGVKRSKKQKWPTIYYVAPFVSALFVTIAMAILYEALSISSGGDAFVLSLVVGVGVSLAITLNNAVTPNMPKQLLFASVVGGYHVVGAVLVGVILSSIG